MRRTGGGSGGYSHSEVLDSIRRFGDLRVLVVGDLFLDEYIEGEMIEISKEGPMPVIRVDSRTRTPGAAGNLASSIRNLGAQVSVAGIVGGDSNGKDLLSALRAKGIRADGVIIDEGRATLTYSKLRARVANSPSQEILRMDVLPREPLSAEEEDAVLERVEAESKGVGGIIVLDQIHHLISSRVLRGTVKIARSRKALLHGSSREHIGSFRGFDLVTPNDREASGAVGAGSRDPERIGRALKELGRHRKVVLTLGEKGLAVFDGAGAAVRCPALAESVADVTGAGDAVSSVALLGNIAGWSAAAIARVSSLGAAIAVEHVGTHHVSREELEARLSSVAPAGFRNRNEIRAN